VSNVKVAIDKGAECAKMIRQEFERLTTTYKLEPTDPTVEAGYDAAYKDEHKRLDYYVVYSGKRIAMLDVSCCNYQLLDMSLQDYSRSMVVKRWKGKIARRQPIFIVYHMNREERYGMPLKNRCIWIKGCDIGNRTKPRKSEPLVEMQSNHYTDINKWHRGLESLIAELHHFI